MTHCEDGFDAIVRGLVAHVQPRLTTVLLLDRIATSFTEICIDAGTATSLYLVSMSASKLWCPCPPRGLMPAPTRISNTSPMQINTDTDQHQFGMDVGIETPVALSTQGFDTGTNTYLSELSQVGGD